MKSLVLTLAVCLAAGALAQEKSVRAVRASHAPVIDADLSDEVWSSAPEITGLVQRDPDEGQPESERSVIRIAYDDHAMYFAAHLYDRSPVTSRLGRRDTTIESDWFRVYLDPDLDRRTGVTFQVNPANVQYDAAIHSDSISDTNWDAVWASATKIVPDGWIVEMAVPLSQLRFPDRGAQPWGINIGRQISRRNEVSRLVFTPKKDAGFVSRFALLTGIEGVAPRRGLELLPYTSARLDQDARALDRRDTRGGAGIDLKYALSGNLTLTGTINPDFGQVEVDPARVNLSQYELFFPEKRPFFVEGSSLFDPDVPSNHIFSFNFDQPMLFYSRRVGRQPQAAGLLGATSPEQTTILGAAKVTGKIAGGWTVALLDALTDKEEGRFDLGGRGEVEPRTNYFIGRIAKDFGEKSSAGLRVTSVTRELDARLEPFLRSAAHSAALDGYRLFGDNTHVLQWSASATRIDGSAAAIARAQRSSARYYQRPDAGHLTYDPSRTSLSGYGGYAMFAKHAGKWQYNIEADAFSPGYETNDVGFMTRSDILTTHAVLLYVDPDPWRNTRRRNFWVGKFQHWNWDGDLIQNGLWYDGNVTFNSYRRGYVWGGTELSTIDDRATRGGPAIRRPRRIWSGAQYGTDTRKPLSFDVWSEQLREEGGGWDNVYAVSATYRPTTRMSLKVTPSYRSSRLSQQYVLTTDGRYIFSGIDQNIVDVAMRADYTFTSRLSLQVYLQPYVATGDYHDFKEVSRPRSHEFNVYDDIAYDPETDFYTVGGVTPRAFSFSDPDFNYRSVRGNAVVRWEFRPGSSLYVVWNESREDELPFGDFRPGRDVRSTFTAPSRDVFMVKVSYWFGT
ncbi:MAG TPA: DUF5916 domain-containing protein [Thermoanaerobaculia bacterium]|jgi:hypothetical protein